MLFFHGYDDNAIVVTTNLLAQFNCFSDSEFQPITDLSAATESPLVYHVANQLYDGYFTCNVLILHQPW